MEITMSCRACGMAVADFDIVKDAYGHLYLQCAFCGWLYKEEDCEYENSN